MKYVVVGKVKGEPNPVQIIVKADTRDIAEGKAILKYKFTEILEIFPKGRKSQLVTREDTFKNRSGTLRSTRGTNSMYS